MFKSGQVPGAWGRRRVPVPGRAGQERACPRGEVGFREPDGRRRRAAPGGLPMCFPSSVLWIPPSWEWPSDPVSQMHKEAQGSAHRD